jgi:hypothetical protein
MRPDQPLATCFISYNHADQPLARAVATGLNAMGYQVWIDEGELRVGDSLVDAISTAIDSVDFLVALVSTDSISSNWCRKELSLAMTGEIAAQGITVLPCRVGNVDMPPALADKLYLSINPEQPDSAVAELHRAMQQHLAPVTALPPRRRDQATPASSRRHEPAPYTPTTEVRMTGIDTNSMTSPRNDGTAGSALYMVPITLNVVPDRTWAELFVRHWDRPSSFSTMHRPGIASVSGSRIRLDGTTIDEVERVHVDTLKLAVAAANQERRALAEHAQRQEQQAQEQRDRQQRAAREAADRIRFD